MIIQKKVIIVSKVDWVSLLWLSVDTSKYF